MLTAGNEFAAAECDHLAIFEGGTVACNAFDNRFHYAENSDHENVEADDDGKYTRQGVERIGYRAALIIHDYLIARAKYVKSGNENGYDDENDAPAT